LPKDAAPLRIPGNVTACPDERERGTQGRGGAMHQGEHGQSLQCHCFTRRPACTVNIEPECLFAIIRREVPPPFVSELSEATELRADLRMAEEDADALLANFFHEFSVAPADFNLTRYFPFEGLWPFGRKRPAPMPLTLGMLLQAARDGVWDTASIENVGYPGEDLPG
jgi:hypothetical protein